MPDTKLDADLAAYEERHLKLEHFLSQVQMLCAREEAKSAESWGQFVPVVRLREAMKGLE